MERDTAILEAGTRDSPNLLNDDDFNQLTVRRYCCLKFSAEVRMVGMWFGYRMEGLDVRPW
jgi:hypothetical protein